jgi:non-specific serine/threonine protein kinase
MVDGRRVDRIGTLLIADIESSTPFRTAVGDELAQRHIDGVLRTITDAVVAGGGEVFKTMGDGVLALFNAPGPAFDVAVRIQRAMVGSQVKVRIGVHAGQLKLSEDDVHGMAVHVADRVTRVAAGGEIVVSAMARALASPEPRWRWSDRGPQALRGLAEPVPVYELVDARPTNDALDGRGPPADLEDEPERVLEPLLVASRTLTPRSLPRYRTSLVGRGEQLDALASLLHPSTVVTLTGVGGAGKTRMAVELASRAGDRWPDGVAFLDLASVADEGLVPNEALAALGLDEEPVRPPVETIVRAVAQRELLFVVDNCEHVRAAAGELIETLLDAAPASAVLATSREPLGLSGERVWPVPPLGRAGADADAVVLLVERARAANPSFEQSGDAEVLAERLEGLPLAIEMIAPWTRSLSTAEIIDRIDHLLAIGGPSGTGRQQTMTTVLDWSDRLLNDRQRRAFHRLGVFLGDFDLGAAEAVLADDQGGTTPVLAELSRLVDCSLVVAEPAGAVVRYRLLEPIRQYALRRLAEDGDEARARDRHLDHYVALAREIGRHANGADARTWFARADQEMSNLRAAHDWALTAGRADQASLLAAALYWYWWIRAASSEGTDRLTRSLALGPTRAVAARARIGLATMLHQAGRRAEAERVADAAREDAEAAGDRRALARALGMLGRLAVDRGDIAAGNARLAAAERLYEEFGNELGLAWIRMVWHANALLEGDQELAARRLDSFDRLVTAGASAWGMANASWIRGAEAARNGDLEEALVRLRDANRLVDDNRLRDELAVNAKSWLAAVLTRLGHHEEARTTLTEALAILEGLPDPAPRACWYLSLAEAAAALGQHELVLRALGARATIDTRTVLPTVDDPVRAELLATQARQALGDARAEALLRSGASDPDPRRGLAALDERPAQLSPSLSRLERVVLRPDGAMWEVGPAGATFRLPDRKGIRALAHLIAHPSVEVHALDLTAVIEGTGAGAVDGPGTGPLLDPTAKAAYRERIADLQDDIDDAGRDHDTARAERARVELEAITDQLAAAVGLGGRDRPSGVLAERARVNVTRVIRDAIARIAQHDPGLGHHLDTCTRTGTFCSYEPPPAGGPEWAL